jgi:hypothetical protein
MRWTLALLTLAACARGRSDEPLVDGSVADAPMTTGSEMRPSDATPSGTCAQAFTGTLATWTFAGAAGTQASTPVATMANGITAGPVTRAAALTAVAGANSINSSNWPVAATRDLTKYYAFTVSPPAGCTLSISGITVDARSSGTGPVSAQISTSTDSYAATTSASTTAAGLVAMAVMDAPAMVEVRVYGYAASATGGTMRLQTTLSVDGQLK